MTLRDLMGAEAPDVDVSALAYSSDSVTPGARVLLVDDVLATGGTMAADCGLIEKAGGTVAGCAFLLELTFLQGREKLKPHEIFSLIHY